jgi:hypothetical protein
MKTKAPSRERSIGDRLIKLIDERNRLIVELRRVNAERFKLQCAMDRLTTRLCAAVGLHLPGDVVSPPDLRKGF